MFVKPNIASQNRIKNGIRLKTVYGLGFMVQGKKDGMRFGGLKDSRSLHCVKFIPLRGGLK